MKAIYKKEFTGYFKTPIGWVFMASFLLVSGLIFNAVNLLDKNNNLTTVLSNTITMFLFLVPILTMRLLSEERNQKTDQALFTAPVSTTSIVLGKYFAAVSVFALTLLSTLLYLVVLIIHGEPAYAEIFGSYFGFFLLGNAFISIGIFISSLTDNQVVAAVATFGALLIFFMIDLVKRLSQTPVLAKIIDWVSITSRFSDFTIGVLNIAPVIYYISFSLVFIVLTVAVLEKRRI